LGIDQCVEELGVGGLSFLKWKDVSRDSTETKLGFSCKKRLLRCFRWHPLMIWREAKNVIKRIVVNCDVSRVNCSRIEFRRWCLLLLWKRKNCRKVKCWNKKWTKNLIFAKWSISKNICSLREWCSIKERNHSLDCGQFAWRIWESWENYFWFFLFFGDQTAKKKWTEKKRQTVISTLVIKKNKVSFPDQ